MTTLPNLLDLLANRGAAGLQSLGPSVGDDEIPRSLGLLGPSVGDDEIPRIPLVLGPSVGDDN